MQVKRCLGIMILLIFGIAYGVSQTSMGSSTELTGLVTDPTGATLPKARVLVVDLKSLETTTMEVGANGIFAFPKTSQESMPLSLSDRRLRILRVGNLRFDRSTLPKALQHISEFRCYSILRGAALES